MNLRRLNLAIPLVLILALLAAVPGVSAQAPADWPSYITVDANGVGTLNTSMLIPGAQIVLPPPPGFPGTIDAFGACIGCLVYNTYTTPEGSTVVLPSASTAIVMALYNYSPFTTQPDFAMGNGIIAAAAAAGAFESIGLHAADLDAMMAAAANPEAFAADLAAAVHQILAADPLALVRLNWEMLSNPAFRQGQWFFVSGLFEFSCHPVTGVCADLPNEPEIDINEIICQSLGDCPVPPTDTCPRDWEIIALDADWSLMKTDPNFPLVVGQDPEKYGVSIQASASVPAVLVRWNRMEVTSSERVCRWHEGTSFGGCGDGYDRLDSPTGEWYADGHWGVDTDEVKECVRKQRGFLDEITQINVEVNLSEASQAWITSGNLQDRHPGAFVYQADWPLWPGRPPSANSMDATRTSFMMAWLKIPFKDPGKYEGNGFVWTKGTPYTTGRLLELRDKFWFEVYLLESALIR